MRVLAGDVVRVVETTDGAGVDDTDIAARHRAVVGEGGHGGAVELALAVGGVARADLHVGAAAHRLDVGAALVVDGGVPVVGGAVGLARKPTLVVADDHVVLEVIELAEAAVLTRVEAQAQPARVVHPVEAVDCVRRRLAAADALVVDHEEAGVAHAVVLGDVSLAPQLPDAAGAVGLARVAPQRHVVRRDAAKPKGGARKRMPRLLDDVLLEEVVAAARAVEGRALCAAHRVAAHDSARPVGQQPRPLADPSR